MRFFRYFIVYLLLAGVGFAAGWGIHKASISSGDGMMAAGDATSGNGTSMPTTAANGKYKDLSTKELLVLGQSLRKEKKFKESFEVLQLVFDGSKPNSTSKGKASYLLGIQYYYAQGIKRDLKKAEALLGDPKVVDNKWAKYYLGMIYASKAYAGRDIAKARAFFIRAEELGIKAATKQLDNIGRS